MEVIEILSF